MEFINKIIEVTYRYNKHTLTFLYNVDCIDDFKLSLRYIRFKQKFGDLLVVNKLIDENNEYIQAHASITLSINTKSPSKEDFNLWLDNILQLFSIPLEYFTNILNSLLKIYPSNEEEILNCHSAIVNRENEQSITVCTEILTSKNQKEFNYIKS